MKPTAPALWPKLKVGCRRSFHVNTAAALAATVPNVTQNPKKVRPAMRSGTAKASRFQLRQSRAFPLELQSYSNSARLNVASLTVRQVGTGRPRLLGLKRL